MRASFTAGVLVAGVLLACGSSAQSHPATGSSTGTIAGNAVPTAGVYAIIGDGGTAPDASIVSVTLTSSAQECSDYQGGSITPSLTYLELDVASPDPSQPPGTGTYPIDGTEVSATLHVTGSQCEEISRVGATSGQIVLSDVGTWGASGTFDLTFPQGDHVTGSFSAPQCEADYTSGRPGPVCPD